MFGSPPQAPSGLSGGNKTRIQNTMIRARQSSMGNNPAAVNSLREVTAPLKKRPKSQVNTDSPDYTSQGSSAVVTQQPYSISALSAHPAAVAEQPEDPVKRYNRDAAIDRIISSPDMMDTVTRLKLRNYFQDKPDEGLGVEALGIVKQMHGIE